MERILYKDLPKSCKKFISENMDINRKMIAAKGLIPLPANELVVALYYFIFDEDEKVRNTAYKSLANLPPNIISSAIEYTTFPSILEFFAKSIIEKSILYGNKLSEKDLDYLKLIIINKNTGAESLELIAEYCQDEKIIESIANNQKKILQYPSIFQALKKNPKTPKNIIERLSFFLKLENISDEALSENQVESIIENISDDLDKMIADQTLNIAAWFQDIASCDSELSIEDEDPLFTDFEGEITEEKKKNIYTMISQMTIPQKIVLALKGNAEVRALLLKDKAKIVKRCVLNNPRLTAKEIESICSDKTQDTEIINSIARNKEWTKNYNVRKLLCCNPKTPPLQAFRFLQTLQFKDIYLMTRNKNVPAHILSAARRKVAERGS